MGATWRSIRLAAATPWVWRYWVNNYGAGAQAGTVRRVVLERRDTQQAGTPTCIVTWC